jgi:hypothetical protein
MDKMFHFSKPVLEALTPPVGCVTDGQTADFDHQNQMIGSPGFVHPGLRCSRLSIQASLCVASKLCMVQPHPALDFLNGRFCFCRTIAHCFHHLSILDLVDFNLNCRPNEFDCSAKNSLRLNEPEALDEWLIT